MGAKRERRKKAADRLRDRITAFKKNHESWATQKAMPESWRQRLYDMEIELSNIEAKL